MELPSLDLNLVVVLHALLEERNVTRAGERVGLSQPGASAALGRLRRHFDDPLLKRVGVKYELTPLAQGLYDQLGEILHDLQKVLAAQSHFDPRTTERRFVVRCSDAVLSVLAPLIVAEVARSAPHAVLDFRTMSAALLDDPMQSLSEIDVLIAPRGLFSLPDIPQVELYTDRWLCATWSGNTTIGNSMTFAQVQQCRWIMPFQEVSMTSPADAALATLGVDRHCAVRVESFRTLTELVTGTDLLVLTHERLMARTNSDTLRLVSLPGELPPFAELAWWHPTRQLDAGHRWFINLIVGQAEQLPAHSPAQAPEREPSPARSR
ncbi:LysR family transcriptional regulator [Rhodococcoides yunnanense]|uniref:LysR family transcriptional regulator n=1 Tax=Rhodococcoides yunnanense TaxID=278209 RepID=UPI000932D78F|nr:LysR family transcriptional regulator [Rhodococcus yunnanensis]